LKLRNQPIAAAQKRKSATCFILVSQRKMTELIFEISCKNFKNYVANLAPMPYLKAQLFPIYSLDKFWDTLYISNKGDNKDGKQWNSRTATYAGIFVEIMYMQYFEYERQLCTCIWPLNCMQRII
jgi:hypothetical protein